MKWAAAFLASVLWVASAMAAPPDFAMCARLGHLARSIAQNRDRGVPYQESIRGINAAAQHAPNEHATALQLARAIYDIPSMTPEGAYKLAAAPCNSAPRP